MKDLDELEYMVETVNDKEDVVVADCFHDHYETLKKCCSLVDRQLFTKDLVQLCSGLKRCDKESVSTYLKAYDLVYIFAVKYMDTLRKISKLEKMDLSPIRSAIDFKISPRV